MKVYKPHLSSIGDAAANIIAMACYFILLVFWSFGIVLLLGIFLLEKKSGFVRFHAAQASLLWLARTLLGGDLSFAGLAAILTENADYMQGTIGWTGDLPTLVGRMAIALLIIVLGIAGIYHAYRWSAWRVPILGWLAVLICRLAAPAAYAGTDAVPDDCRMAVPQKRRWFGRRGDEEADDEDLYGDEGETEPQMTFATAAARENAEQPARARRFTVKKREDAPAALDEDEAAAAAETSERAGETEKTAAPAAKPRYREVPGMKRTGCDTALPPEMRDHPLVNGENEPVFYEEARLTLARMNKALVSFFSGRPKGEKAKQPPPTAAMEPDEAFPADYGAGEAGDMDHADDMDYAHAPPLYYEEAGEAGGEEELFYEEIFEGEGEAGDEAPPAKPKSNGAFTISNRLGGMLQRLAGARQGGAPAELPRDDPNHNLPPDMRDPPASAGML